jgi:hypothetical protein
LQELITKKKWIGFQNCMDLPSAIKNYPTKIFKSEINRDVLLREILDNHIVVSGSEEFIEAAVM